MFCSSHFSLHLVLWFAVILYAIGFLKLSSCVAEEPSLACRERERQALFKLKDGLNDPSLRLSSWSGRDCCSWSGIVCNNTTGHVIKLNLRNPYRKPEFFRPYPSSRADEIEAEFNRSCLSGEINPSLLELKYLNHLDLSRNCFGGMAIPKFIGSITELRYLNLSYADFGGQIPHELGNLSSLIHLGLNNGMGSNELDLYKFNDLYVDKLDWVTRLSSLKNLEMNHVNLSLVSDQWLLSINMCPSLQTLHLSYCNLPSIHPTSLPHLNFTSLSNLDLSANDMVGPVIPDWLLNVTGIANLDLSQNHLSGPIPVAIKSLCNLQSLDLSGNYLGGEMNGLRESFSGCLKNNFENLLLSDTGLNGSIPDWIGQFTNLKVIDFSFNNISGTISASLTQLPLLKVLNLGSNSLHGLIPVSLGRLLSLELLDLSNNSFSGPIPASIGNLSQLVWLYLGYNSLTSIIPVSFGKLLKLKVLALDENFLTGPIPTSFDGLSKLAVLSLPKNSLTGPFPAHVTSSPLLTVIDLSSNNLSGSIPSSLGQMSQLVVCDVNHNSLEGVLSEVHFWNLTRLETFIIEGNSLTLNVSPSWVPPFQLTYINMNGCKIGPRFPQWLRTQKRVGDLYLGGASISDAIPDWIWNISSLQHISLSENSITSFVYSSNTRLPPNLFFLTIDSNQLTRSIFPFICQMSSLQVLLLSNNYLSGTIPECLVGLQSLVAVMLDNNSLTGNIPRTIGGMSLLQALHLGYNNLSGKLPSSLKNCKALVILDVRGNGFSGNIPTWIGESLRSLKFLNLRTSKFSGTIPTKLSLLSQLQFLDLAENNLSGGIALSFQNFDRMRVPKTMEDLLQATNLTFVEMAWVFWKGHNYFYRHRASLMVSIDLSSNDLHGPIPKKITLLHGLRNLNLSNNHLMGEIPEKIGDLGQIESLDLSNNKLSGMIPYSMANLNFLGTLNLSYNNLSGRIPSGHQLNTLDDPYIYIGNPNLCGDKPFLNPCPGSETTQSSLKPGVIEDEKRLHVQPFYVAMASGFIMGFWMFCGILLLSKTWRIGFFRICDAAGGWIYVAVAVKIVKFRLKALEKKNSGSEQ